MKNWNSLKKNLKLKMKKLFFRFKVSEAVFVHIKKRELETSYLIRREGYFQENLKKEFKYKDDSVQERTLEILKRRQLDPIAKSGPYNIIAFIPQISWHPHLLSELKCLGHVENFDYIEMKFSRDLALTLPKNEFEKRLQEVNDRFFEFCIEASKIRKFDFIFYYANGMEILASTLERIKEALKIPAMSLCLDDKHSWDLATVCNQNGGMKDLAGVTELSITSARVSCEWYMLENGNPIFLPEGVDFGYFNKNWQEQIPEDGPDICFVGELYGMRKQILRELSEAGLHVQAYGKGTANGLVSDDEYRRLCRTSKIFLGMAGIGYSRDLKNIKGRDFEVLAAGACYLTTFEPDLSVHFTHRKHLMYYSTTFELIENARELLTDLNLRQRIRTNAVIETGSAHTWESRLKLASKMFTIR